MGSSDYLLIAGLVMIALWCVFGIMVYRYRPKGTIRDAPRSGIAAITVVAAALMILFAALSFSDGELGEVFSTILFECVLSVVVLWLILYVVLMVRVERGVARRYSSDTRSKNE